VIDTRYFNSFILLFSTFLWRYSCCAAQSRRNFFYLG